MTGSEVRDIVRESVGRDKASEHFLLWGLTQGLREIEKAGNFYWMRAVKTWSCVVDQQGYSITTSASSGLNIPNHKDNRILLISDQTLTNPDWDEVFGPIDMEDAGLSFADTDEGMPVIYSIDEDTTTGSITDLAGSSTPTKILLYPPKPDKTYSMRLHYYQWTSLPTDLTLETHEVLKRWPEALIYTATEAIMVNLTKDPAAGVYWRAKFTNKQNGGELRRIQRYNRERAQDSRMELRPLRGGLMARSRRRGREVWL